MHMADGILAPAVAVTMYAASTAVAGYSISRIKKVDEPEKIPIMGVMGAFVFAAQMINFTIPGTGSSGHLCGGMMLSSILGPEAGFITMIGVLLIQCLLFADGGLMALGANIWNMAFYGCFIGGYLIWKLFMKNGVSKTRITVASIVGCVLTLQMGAFSIVLETMASGITELPFSLFFTAMQTIHLAIGLFEGLITAAVLVFVYEARPELLWVGKTHRQGKVSSKRFAAIIIGLTILVGGGLSLFASSFPDGLEWSMERVAGTSELEGEGEYYDMAASIQETTAILPDYSFKSDEEGSAVGTSVSGIFGAAVVIALCTVVCYGLKFFKKTEKEECDIKNNE